MQNISNAGYNTMTKAEKVIDGILKYARKEILKKFKVDSCIVSSKIALEICKFYELKAKPLACEVRVVNNIYRKFLMENKRWPENSEELDKIVKEGAYSVGIGYGFTKEGPNAEAKKSKEDKWPGHLVVIIEDTDKTDYLLDISIDQASRPEKNIILKPIALPVERIFHNTDDITVMDIKNSEEDDLTTIFWYSNPRKKGYEKSVDWTHPTRNNDIITKVICEIGKIE